MRTNMFSKALISFAFLLLFVGFSSSFAQVPSPVAWVATSGGNIPATAVAAGKEANGQALFLCRAKYGPDNGVHPGKTRREFNGCNIGWGGREVAVAQYEVAVSVPAGATWQPTTGANIPATAIIGGQEAAGVLAICRANHQGGVHPGKTRREFNGCNIGWGGSEVAIPQYEVLVMASQAVAPAPAPAPAPGVAAGWTQMPGAAVDIGAAGAGQVWVTNKGQNIYRWVNNNWTQMPGAAVRVAVDPSGNAWVVNAGGGIYHWENNNWKQIPGALTDIGVGGPAPNGTVWGVNAGQEIFRLNGASWQKMPGAAVRVAVDPAGNAWVVNAGGGIYTWVNNNWVQRPGAAKDVAVCSTGAVYVIGTDNAPYKWNGTNNWDKQPGGPLLNIACDGTGRLYATTPTEQILTAGPATTPAPVAAAVPFMGCQQMSNTLGTNHGVTWGSANALQQQQWQANGCNTRPQAAAPVAAAPVAAAPVAAAPGAAPTLDCRSGEVLSAKGCVSLAAAQLSINAGNAAVCTKNQTAYLANEEIVAKNKGNEIQVKIKAVEDEKISKDNKTNIDYAPNPKFDRSANDYQKNQLRLVLANNQQGAQDKIRALTNEQVAWTAQHKAKVENWLKDSSSNKSICP